MVSAADRARQKAGARRSRILAQSAQRLDVVNGLAPSGPSVTSNDDAATPTGLGGATGASGTVLDVPTVVEEDAAAVSESPAAEPSTETDTTPTEETGNTALSGSRRMNAMRRRRRQTKKSKGEQREEESNIEAATSGGVREEEKTEIKKDRDTADADTAVHGTVVGKEDESVAKKEETNETPSSTTAHEENSRGIAAAPAVEEKREEGAKPKKYMGVARTRRRILKEQKAQRLKDIADAEVMQANGSSEDLKREVAAEMVTIDMTMSKARKGGMVMDDSKVNLSGIMGIKKSLRKGWYSALVPPMKLVPRLVTLLLLFFAGLDLGLQPHGAASPGRASPLDIGGVASRNLSSVRSLIQHVEPSFTKPWEYGMGGKAAYMVGMAPSSPPTAMPTSFNMQAMVCTAGDDTNKDCVAPKQDKIVGDPKPGKLNTRDKGGKKKRNIIAQLLGDDFDSTPTRPRGVSHGDEFDEAVPTIGKSNNVDPIFQVDLDALLENVRLPFPIDFAAKCAIGFHRAWLYYLWTLPTSLMKSMVYAPKTVLSGWISNPPWILGLALLIRFIARVLAGNGKSLSLDPENENSSDGSGKGDAGGGGSKNFDLVAQITDTAKNYISSKFPQTTLVVKTLLQVMRLDMYIVLCGLLIGLVTPSIKEDYLVWSGSSGEWRGWLSRTVLGDGEL